MLQLGWEPVLIEGLLHIGAFLHHDLAPVCAERIEEHLDGLICMSKAIFVEFLHLLFLDAVNGALNADGSHRLLEIELFLECLQLFLDGQDCVLVGVFVDVWVDCFWFGKGCCWDDDILGDCGIIRIIEDKRREPCSPPHAVVLTGATIWAICSITLSMILVVGWPTIKSSGLATILRATI